VSRSAAEWTLADCPSSNQPGHRPPTSDQRPATSGTVPCVPERSGVDTGGLSLLESDRPPTTDQRPPTNNVWVCPLYPGAQRSGHWRTVPPRRPSLTRRGTLSTASRSWQLRSAGARYHSLGFQPRGNAPTHNPAPVGAMFHHRPIYRFRSSRYHWSWRAGASHLVSRRRIALHSRPLRGMARGTRKLAPRGSCQAAPTPLTSFLFHTGRCQDERNQSAPPGNDQYRCPGNNIRTPRS